MINEKECNNLTNKKISNNKYLNRSTTVPLYVYLEFMGGIGIKIDEGRERNMSITHYVRNGHVVLIRHNP